MNIRGFVTGDLLRTVIFTRRAPIQSQLRACVTSQQLQTVGVAHLNRPLQTIFVSEDDPCELCSNAQFETISSAWWTNTASAGALCGYPTVRYRSSLQHGPRFHAYTEEQ
jgi:hypothetical protein